MKPYIDRKTIKKLIKETPNSFTKKEIKILFDLCDEEENRIQGGK
tara:strand:+ start:212 stop:346 length:135 start_codon:yes stop_codon:yes gene_type:complete